MTDMAGGHTFDAVVVGGGQAGLATAYHLACGGADFVVLDENERSGEAWRSRWDSLRLFTPAIYDGLPGYPFPAERNYYPTKDEMADYLEDYVARFDLPVAGGEKAEALGASDDGGYIVATENREYRARNVVVATGPYHTPKIPDFAAGLDGGIVQLHSSEYRGRDSIPEGDVLIVGAGNSGAEISYDAASHGHATYLSGRDTGSMPLAVLRSRLFWWLGSRFNTDTALGRKAREFDRSVGSPLIRLDKKQLDTAGVRRVPRMTGLEGGYPKLQDGRVLQVRSVVWATGFRPDFGWIELPVFDGGGYPEHYRGEVEKSPGLYFVGLPFLYTFSSAVVCGVGGDVEYVVRCLMRKNNATFPMTTKHTS